MTEAEALDRFGVVPEASQLPDIRACLLSEIARYSSEQAADELIKLLCVQLFSGGAIKDTFLIWKAKQLSFDMSCSVDVQLLCGAGLEITKQFLSEQSSDEARQSLAYIRHCESVGNFDDFSPESYRSVYQSYYEHA